MIDYTKIPQSKVRQVAYEEGYQKAVNDCIKIVEDSKSLFDNTTRWTISEKGKLINQMKDMVRDK